MNSLIAFSVELVYYTNYYFMLWCVIINIVYIIYLDLDLDHALVQLRSGAPWQINFNIYMEIWE